MPEVVEAETVANWNLDHLVGRWPKMVFDQHIRHARCFAFEPGGGEDEILVPGIRRRLAPVLDQPHNERM